MGGGGPAFNTRTAGLHDASPPSGISPGCWGASERRIQAANDWSQSASSTDRTNRAISAFGLRLRKTVFPRAPMPPPYATARRSHVVEYGLTPVLRQALRNAHERACRSYYVSWLRGRAQLRPIPACFIGRSFSKTTPATIKNKNRTRKRAAAIATLFGTRGSCKSEPKCRAAQCPLWPEGDIPIFLGRADMDRHFAAANSGSKR
jgi:hypothetical protein